MSRLTRQFYYGLGAGIVIGLLLAHGTGIVQVGIKVLIRGIILIAAGLLVYYAILYLRNRSQSKS